MKEKSPQERRLDEAVRQTFPASDPVSPRHITGTEEPGSDPTRRAPVISSEDVARAAAATETCPRCHGTGRVVKADQSA